MHVNLICNMRWEIIILRLLPHISRGQWVRSDLNFAHECLGPCIAYSVHNLEEYHPCFYRMWQCQIMFIYNYISIILLLFPEKFNQEKETAERDYFNDLVSNGMWLKTLILCDLSYPWTGRIFLVNFRNYIGIKRILCWSLFFNHMCPRLFMQTRVNIMTSGGHLI